MPLVIWMLAAVLLLCGIGQAYDKVTAHTPRKISTSVRHEPANVLNGSSYEFHVRRNPRNPIRPLMWYGYDRSRYSDRIGI